MNDAERAVQQINDQFKKHANAIQALDAYQQKLVSAIDDHAMRINHLASQQRSGLQEQTQYNNIVMTVGYAGFFGLWSLVKEFQPGWQSTFSTAAICMALSLMVFVLWEVIIMGARTVAGADPRDFAPDGTWLRKRCNQIIRHHARAWPYQYIWSLSFGVAAYLCLVVVLLAELAQAI